MSADTTDTTEAVETTDHPHSSIPGVPDAPTPAPETPAGPSTWRLTVEYDALTEMVTRNGDVLWERHRRGKNWMASIAKDPTAPNGLGRAFWEKARGDYFYMVPEGLTPGTPVEIGADYYTGSGHPSRRRWYGIVTAVEPDAVSVRECATPAAAFAAAKEFVTPEPEPAPEPEPEPTPAGCETLAHFVRALDADGLDALAAVLKSERARRRKEASRG